MGTQCALQVWGVDNTQEDEFSLQDVSLVALRVLHKCPNGGAGTLGVKGIWHLAIYHPPEACFSLAC